MNIFPTVVGLLNKRCLTNGVPLLVVLGATLVTTACGGGSGDSTPNPTPDPIVSTTSTDDLKTAASLNIGSSLDSTLDGAESVTSGDSGNLVQSDSGVAQLWNDEARSFINTSLALDDDTNESTTREGSRVTIDPDEAAVCAEGIVDMATDQVEYERCQALVRDMIVQIDATTDNAGSVTYFFQTQPLAVMGYSESSNSFELHFGALKLLIDAENALNPDAVNSEGTPDTFQGAIKLSAIASNTTSGAEAGSVSLEVSQPISIVSTDAATSLSLGNGKLFDMSVDAASESGKIELDIGAVQASTDEDGSVQTLDMNGLTAIIDFAADAEQLTVRNLGIGQGPLRVALDNSDVLRLRLDTFGFTVTEQGDDILLDGQLNLSLFMNEILEDNTVVDTMGTLLELTAPAGTRVGEDLNGSTMVSGVGPLSYSLTEPDDNGNPVVTQLTINAGQCADDDELVSCE